MFSGQDDVGSQKARFSLHEKIWQFQRVRPAGCADRVCFQSLAIACEVNICSAYMLKEPSEPEVC